MNACIQVLHIGTNDSESWPAHKDKVQLRPYAKLTLQPRLLFALWPSGQPLPMELGAYG